MYRRLFPGLAMINRSFVIFNPMIFLFLQICFSMFCASPCRHRYLQLRNAKLFSAHLYSLIYSDVPGFFMHQSMPDGVFTKRLQQKRRNKYGTGINSIGGSDTVIKSIFKTYPFQVKIKTQHFQFIFQWHYFFLRMHQHHTDQS